MSNKGKPIKELRTTGIRLPPKIFEELDRIANETGINRTDLMKLGIINFLKDYKGAG